MATKRLGFPDVEYFDELDDFQEFEFDPEQTKISDRSRSKRKKIRKKKKGRDRHPDPWDDDWFDPEDIL